MRKRIVALGLVAFGVVLWGEALAGSGVPLQAVEANTQPGMGDGPTPFPRPAPPKPKPTDPVSAQGEAAEAVYAWVRGATWWTRRADGALVWHDCASPERIEQALSFAPRETVETAKNLTTESAELVAGLAPWREGFRAGVDPVTPIDDVNEAWWSLVAMNKDAVLLAVQEQQGLSRGLTSTCTEGRCDCCTTTACCPSGNCGCETYNAAIMDCQKDRDSCSVDYGPKKARRANPRLPW